MLGAFGNATKNPDNVRLLYASRGDSHGQVVQLLGVVFDGDPVDVQKNQGAMSPVLLFPSKKGGLRTMWKREAAAMANR